NPHSMQMGAAMLGAGNSGIITVDGAVDYLEVQGQPGLQGTVVLVPGTGIALTQSGQDITVAAQTHALLDGVIDSDTVAHAPVAGDLIYANSTPAWTRLPVSATNGQVLTVVSGAPAWAAAAGGGSWTQTVETISANTVLSTPTANTEYFLSNAAAYNLTLPAAASSPYELILTKTDGNNNILTLLPASGDNLNGNTTASILLQSQYQSIRLISDGVHGWYVSPDHLVQPVYKNGNYTVGVADQVIIADCSGPAYIQITIPNASLAAVGRQITVRSVGGSGSTSYVSIYTAGNYFDAGSDSEYFLGGAGPVTLGSHQAKLTSQAVTVTCVNKSGTAYWYLTAGV
ncbi:MAG TPA: hypothetical protein VGT42_05405, partial [Gammaproteobacteria bacterium]|nr:hypothetical protein [Gammaproteobacteria bacterium]